MTVYPPPVWARPRIRQLRRGGGLIIISPPPTGGAVALPALFVDMTAPAVTGTVWDCPDSASFANALAFCLGGDRINLYAGTVYTPTSIDGFRLPVKSGGWVTITLRDADLANLPPISANGTFAGSPDASRVGYPHYNTGKLAIIQTYHGVGNNQRGIAFRVAKGFNSLYIRGVAARVNPTYAGVQDLSWFQFGGYGTGSPAGDQIESLADIPHHIIVQQCYASNEYNVAAKRSMEFHVDYGAVANSMLIGRGTQSPEVNAMWVNNCNGPQWLHNTAFIAPGINLFYGGADLSASYMTDRMCSDVLIEYCWFYKPDEWMDSHANYAGVNQNLKNSLELKWSRRFHIRRNIFDGSTVESSGGQSGQTITIKVLTEANYSNPKSSAGAMPGPGEGGNMYWAENGHLTIEENWSRRCGSGYDLQGNQDTLFSGPAGTTHHMHIRNNLIDYTRNLGYNGVRRAFNYFGSSALAPRAYHWTIEHNTILGEGITYFQHGPVDDLVLRNNLRSFANNNYVGGMGWFWGVISGAATANAVPVDLYAPGILNDAAIGDFASRYNNRAAGGGYATVDGGTIRMGGSDVSYGLNADGSLTPGSVLRLAGSDGLDIGSTVDVPALCAGVATPALLPPWP